jgi:hypothetical protein
MSIHPENEPAFEARFSPAEAETPVETDSAIRSSFRSRTAVVGNADA